jgi:hypothetical protein
MSPKAQRRYGHTAHLAGTGDGERAMPLRNRQSSVVAQVAFRLDFSAWLSTRPEQERHYIQELAAGDCPHQVALRHHIWPAVLTNLRVAWRRSWARYCRQ